MATIKFARRQAAGVFIGNIRAVIVDAAAYSLGDCIDLWVRTDPVRSARLHPTCDSQQLGIAQE